MGLLDDAIRDHLELKRRRGADPDEVEREEQEALDSPAGFGGAQREPSGEPAAAEEQVQETAEVDMRAVMDEQVATPAPDVLEQTPEFLRETPEHERLWFEQRPPRDFDFDG